jgi:hypothetical protein
VIGHYEVSGKHHRNPKLTSGLEDLKFYLTGPFLPAEQFVYLYQLISITTHQHIHPDILNIPKSKMQFFQLVLAVAALTGSALAVPSPAPSMAVLVVRPICPLPL